MPSLIILAGHYQTNFRMKGLKISLHHDLCKDETGFYISNEFKTNGRTARININDLVKFLKELHEELPFNKIKIKDHYEISGEELMKLVNS